MKNTGIVKIQKSGIQKVSSVISITSKLLANANNKLAEDYYKIGIEHLYYKNDEAVLNFNKAIELNPDYAMAYQQRATAKEYLKDYQGAIDDYSKALELEPDFGELWGYFDRGKLKAKMKDLTGAIEDFSKAIDVLPTDNSNYTERGIIKSNLGKYEEAIEDFTKSIDLKPNGDAFFWRGMARKAKGETIGACQDWITAKNMDNKDANEMINKYCKT